MNVWRYVKQVGGWALNLVASLLLVWHVIAEARRGAMKRSTSILMALVVALAVGCATTTTRTDTEQKNPYSYGQPYHGTFGGHR